MNVPELRRTLFIAAALLVLVGSALWTVPAKADDSVPPASAPTEVSTEASAPAPSDTSSPPPAGDSPQPPADSPAPTDSAPAPTSDTGATSASTDVPASGQGGNSLVPSVPAGTHVVVVDDSGKSVPLATRKAARLMATGDPIWCPSGVTPRPGKGGCSGSYSDLQSLILDVGAGLRPKANGVIWIENVTYAPNGAIVFDGTASTAFTKWSTFDLTLRGGWVGCSTPPCTGTISGTSTLQDSLTITHWVGNITLSDIEITGVTSGTALAVDTKKKITLTRVNVHDNTGGGGAKLDNCEWNGTKCKGAGAVTVTDSEFSNNTATGAIGLEIYSNGSITLNSIVAEENGGIGAYLHNDQVILAMPVTVKGSNGFNLNGDTGLSIKSKGLITLGSLTATGNGTAGAGSGAVLDNSAGNGGVKLTSAGVFSSNHDSGLIIKSRGAITLHSITANTNPNGEGASIDNSTGAAKPVTLTGINSFGSNSGTGLKVLSKGAIKISNLTANGNGLYGASLANDNGSGGVTVSGHGDFSNNGGSAGVDANLAGLLVRSKGTVRLANLTADTNGNYVGSTSFQSSGYGVFIQNDAGHGNVILSGTNEFSSNFLSGLEVYSRGRISLSNVQSNNNGYNDPAPDDDSHLRGYGAFLDNQHALPFAEPVTLTGYGVFNGNATAGLDIESEGTVSARNLTANNNAAGGVSIDNTHANLPAAVIVRGTNEFSNNQFDGLHIASTGAITVYNVTANNNYNGSTAGFGVFLANAVVFTPKNVTVNGYAHVGQNGQSGLFIDSAGTLTLNNIVAMGNGQTHDPLEGFGANVSNQTGLSQRAIILRGTNNFSSNYAGGLIASSGGPIQTHNITADSNGDPAGTFDGFGTDLSTTFSSATVKAVNVTGINSFSHNNGNGFHIAAAFSIAHNTGTGIIVLNNITASGNKTPTGFTGVGHGLLAYNDGCGAYLAHPATGNCAGRKIVLAGSNFFNDNDGVGLQLSSFGKISLHSLTVNNNGLNTSAFPDPTVRYAADISNLHDGATKAYGVTLSGTNTFNDNADTGLRIDTYGKILVNNVTGNHNGIVNTTHSGTVLWNAYRNSHIHGSPSITLTGTNVFGTNLWNGLLAETYGGLTASKVIANNNGGIGMWVINCQMASNVCTGAGPVTIKAGVFNSNGDQAGLRVDAKGAVTLKNITASNNTIGDGAIVDTCQFGATKCGGAGSVKVSFSHFDGNAGPAGLNVNAKGAVVLSNIGAAGNTGSYGVLVDTCQYSGLCTAGGTVTVLNSSFTGNTVLDGLRIDAKGDIKLSGVTANTNHSGAHLSNCLEVAGACISKGNILITGSHFDNNTVDYGLLAFSNGTITLHGVVANGNLGGAGVQLVNWHSTGTPGIALNLGAFDFSGNGADGLDMWSKGTVTLKNIHATLNLAGGTFVDNCTEVAGACTGVGGVNVIGTNVFSSNISDGLVIQSNRAILLNNVTANLNTGSWGVDVENLGGASGHGTKGVTLTGTNQFNQNGSGLRIRTNGAISLHSVTGSGNTSTDGISLDNSTSTALIKPGITLTGTNTANNNGGRGFSIVSRGSLTLHSLNAGGNTSYGAQLDTCLDSGGCTAAGNITMTGINTFNANHDDGLHFSSGGVVSIQKRITANGNTGDGVDGTSVKNITMQCGSTLNNTGYGWTLSAPTATLKVNGVVATGNLGPAQTNPVALHFITHTACPLP